MLDGVIISKSEWGSYERDRDVDMKVLRKRAEGAVRFFNHGNPRKEMQTNVFGYPFSIIDNGKLADVDNAYKGNVIIRSLSCGGGIYEGKVTLDYNDSYNDGRGQGGSGCVLIGDVRDVRIEGDLLIISGMDLNKPVSYAYRIQDRPDDKRFVFPVPKRKIEDTDDDGPEGPPQEVPRPSSKPAVNKEYVERLLNVTWGDLRISDINFTLSLKDHPEIRILSGIFPNPDDEMMDFGRFSPDGIYTEIEWIQIPNGRKDLKEASDESLKIFRKWATAILGMRFDGKDGKKAKAARPAGGPAVRPSPGSVPKPAPKPKPKPTVKPKEKTPGSKKSPANKDGPMYEVRDIEGNLIGTFSQRTKAINEKKKNPGARVFTVFG